MQAWSLVRHEGKEGLMKGKGNRRNEMRERRKRLRGKENKAGGEEKNLSFMVRETALIPSRKIFLVVNTKHYLDSVIYIDRKIFAHGQECP